MTAERIKALEDALRDVLNGENWRAGKKFDPNSGNFDLSVQRAALVDSQPAPEVRPGAPITITYTNWRGDTEVRRIIPRRIWWGSTEWHPEPQWLLTAFDVDKQAERDFALKDFDQPLTVQDAARVPEIAALIGAADLLVAVFDESGRPLGRSERKLRDALRAIEGGE